MEGAEVPDGYLCQIVMSDGYQHEYEDVHTCLDYRLPQLLRWLYNYMVHRVPGNDVIAYEEVVYMVHEASVGIDAEQRWWGLVKCWDVWDQQVLTFKFKLAPEN